jgi:hypothetical protein
MSRGLMWQAFGKSMSDAGAMYGKYVMAQDAEEKQSARERAAEERLNARELAKEERLLAKEETLKQRVLREIAETDTRAENIGVNRDAKGLLDLAKTLPQGEMSGTLSDEDRETVRNMPQAARAAYQEAGAIDKRDSRMVAADDRVQAAMEIGAHSTVMDALQKARTATLNEIKEENKEEKDIRGWKERELAAERAHKQQLAAIAAQGQNALAVVQARGGSGSDGPKLTPRQESEAKIFSGNVTAAEKALAEARSALSGATNSIKKKAAEAAVTEATTALSKANRRYSDFWDRVEGKRSTPGTETPDNKTKQPPAISTVSGAPKGATIGAFVAGKGWEVRQGGKVIGYAED